MAITRKPQSLCLKETENWNSSYKTLFHKDCSLERERESMRACVRVRVCVCSCVCDYLLVYENFPVSFVGVKTQSQSGRGEAFNFL